MMKYIIAFAALFYTSFALAENNCAELFETQNKIEDTIKNLAELKISLDIAKAKGLSSIELTALADNYKNKSLEFYRYVRENNLMTKDQYRERLRQMIIDLQSGKIQADTEASKKRKEEAKIREAQTKDLEDSRVDGTRLVMHRIEPGSFLKGDEQIETTIANPFEMSATVTTQVVWKKVVELANSKFGSKYKNLKPDPSNFKGETHPLEMATYNEVLLWIEALNELSQAGDTSLVGIIPKHKAGDVYRLPTADEWEFVARGRGIYNSKYHFGDDPNKLKNYAWFDENSNKSTHPVAALKPLLIGDKEFYDMYGNVYEWTSDLYEKNTSSDLYEKNISVRAIRGGSWRAESSDLESAHQSGGKIDGCYSIIGFRLVKVAK